jgi:hypothetical protein
MTGDDRRERIMDAYQSPRWRLPLLAIGQAQKELYHNESLILLDFLVHPVVQDIANDPANLTPTPGECWIVGSNPLGDWAGKAQQIAGWTDSGWRYIAPQRLMCCRILGSALAMRFDGAQWQSAANIPALEPSSATIAQLVESLNAIIALLRLHNFIPLSD